MKCGAELHIADDHGDNHATMRCELTPGHGEEIPHREQFIRSGKPVVVTWFVDERDDEVEP